MNNYRYNTINMFRNYFKIAIRNLWKSKGYSAINIFGLAIGLSCFLLIGMYVLDELSYDRHLKNAGRIYRINSDIRFGGSQTNLPVTSDMMGSTLKKDFPQIEEFARIYVFSGSKLVKKGTDFITETKLAHADSTFFTLFPYTAIEGNLNTALNEPNTVVITKSAALKYFGTTASLGKMLETNDTKNPLYKVTAVIPDIPEQTHFDFDFYFSMDNVQYDWGNYLSHNFHTYLMFREGIDYKSFEKNLETYIENYVFPQAKMAMQISSMEEFEQAGNSLRYSLLPVEKIHLYSTRPYELSAGGSIQYVFIFSAVALLILMIACINFMNLTTARSANRAREVGIRKVLGSERKNLIIQFLTESVIMTFISLLIAFIIAYLLLPLFNNISNKALEFNLLVSPGILIFLFLLPVIVGLLAGSYPAFYLSSFIPIKVLKGKLQSGSKSGGLRSVLVVVQFATSIILITATVIIYRQLHFIQTKNLGYEKDQVLVINETNALKGNVEAFKNEMLRVPGVTHASLTGFLPVPSARNDESFFTSPVLDASSGFNMQHWRIDYTYFETMGMELVKGRAFSPDFGSDSSAMILNESAVRLLGLSDPIGKKIYSSKDRQTGEILSYTVIGVVKDFHFESMRQEIAPLSFILGQSSWLASFRIQGDKAASIIRVAEQKFSSMAPGMPFSYQFMDESFAEVYRTELRVGKLALIFSVLAIFIACLGLLALATFMAEQRTKEIGIRKVLGADVGGIVNLLSKDFIKLVLIAFIIATPLAWYVMNSWLEDFAFRIQIRWWVFIVSGLIALFIALITVSVQAIRAALMNPVNSLRAE